MKWAATKKQKIDTWRASRQPLAPSSKVSASSLPFPGTKILNSSETVRILSCVSTTCKNTSILFSTQYSTTASTYNFKPSRRVSTQYYPLIAFVLFQPVKKSKWWSVERVRMMQTGKTLENYKKLSSPTTASPHRVAATLTSCASSWRWNQISDPSSFSGWRVASDCLREDSAAWKTKFQLIRSQITLWNVLPTRSAPRWTPVSTSWNSLSTALTKSWSTSSNRQSWWERTISPWLETYTYFIHKCVVSFLRRYLSRFSLLALYELWNRLLIEMTLWEHNSPSGLNYWASAGFYYSFHLLMHWTIIAWPLCFAHAF